MFEIFRKRIASSLTALCLAALAMPGPLMAASVTINQDTVIDAANSFPDDHVRIADGVSQPTHVDLLAGGEVRGFTVTGDSVLEINGGASTILSGLQDNATLIMRGGSIECTTFLTCSVIDYNALLTLTDSSSMHVFGGTIVGAISLEDHSTAHFYGRGLTISTDDRGTFIEGELADGTIGYYNIGTVPYGELDSRVFLHEIPEPGSFINSLAIFLATLGSRIKATVR
jgi:hypothetical protein